MAWGKEREGGGEEGEREKERERGRETGKKEVHVQAVTKASWVYAAMLVYALPPCAGIILEYCDHVHTHTDSLPDRLINPEEYKPPFHTTQGHTTAKPTEEGNEAHRRLIPVYTYGPLTSSGVIFASNLMNMIYCQYFYAFLFYLNMYII